MLKAAKERMTIPDQGVMSPLCDDVQDLQSDIADLHQLLEVLRLRSEDQTFVCPDGSRSEVADHIYSLVKIAAAMTARIVNVDACVVKSLDDAKARTAVRS
jgi:hypothetical protein